MPALIMWRPFFLDGSCPAMEILMGVVEAFEQTVAQKKGIAVHCKAGLGRTGTCIGNYLVKQHKIDGMTETVVLMEVYEDSPMESKNAPDQKNPNKTKQDCAPGASRKFTIYPRDPNCPMSSAFDRLTNLSDRISIKDSKIRRIMLILVTLIGLLAAHAAAGKLPVPKEYLGVPSDDVDWFPVAGTRSTPNMRKLNDGFECFATLKDVYFAMELKDPEVFEVYKLCPNQVYEIQNPDDLVDGVFLNDNERDFALFPRKNSRVQCGRKGRSSDNCVLRGGIYQFLTIEFNWPEAENTNIVIKGLTFEAPRVGVLLFGPDQVKFVDCVWRNHDSPLGIFISSYSGQFALPPDGNVVERQKVIIKKSVLENNSLLFEPNEYFNSYEEVDESIRAYGIFTIENTGLTDLKIVNTLFRNNLYGDDTIIPSNEFGYALFAEAGNRVVLKTNCFLDNDFLGNGTVVLNGEDALKRSNGNFGTVDDDLVCQYINFGDDTCKSYERNKCKAVIVGDDDDDDEEDWDEDW